VVMDAKRDLVGQPTTKPVPVPGRTCLTRESVSSASVRIRAEFDSLARPALDAFRLSGGFKLMRCRRILTTESAHPLDVTHPSAIENKRYQHYRGE